MEGGVLDGITQGTNDIILDIIKEDAAGYKFNAPIQYAEAAAFYASTSSEDSQSDLIKAIVDATPDENLAKLRLPAAHPQYAEEQDKQT
ncbi:Uncharacterized protein LW93_4558 [Fusarium fujikuroi]|nr:Uncharacterized protein LW93_4558 [Fusarium fujikuroi]